jgi:hypothetical protein
VNLESRFWSDSLPDARATVTLDGWLVDATARPIAYAWAFGDGTMMVADGPGSSDAPARVTYRRRGDHGVTLYVVWAGTARVSAPALGLDLGTQELGTVTIGAPIVHHVAEIRALLRSTTRRR